MKNDNTFDLVCINPTKTLTKGKIYNAWLIINRNPSFTNRYYFHYTKDFNEAGLVEVINDKGIPIVTKTSRFKLHEKKN